MHKNYELIKEYFASQNCTLLESDYINNRIPLKYECVCGGEGKTNYSNFKNGQRCKNCKSESLRKINTKYDYDYVKNFYTEQGCILLSTDYVSCSNELNYICSCGNKGKCTFTNFKLGRRCINCKVTKRAESRRTPINEVQNYFNKENYTLLSDKYINGKTPLKFRCPNGHEHEMTLDSWKIGCRCRKCYEKNNVGVNHPNWLPDRELKAFKDSLRRRYHSMIHNVLNQTGQRKTTKSFAILGYGYKELTEHLRSFSEFETLIKNVWHIDHIFPICAFLDYNIIDPAVINALENLKPMTGNENSVKSGKYDKEEFERYLKLKRLL